MDIKLSNNKGFTLIEVVMTIGIISILFGFIGVNLTGLTTRTTLNSQIDLLISDMRNQQVRSMESSNATSSASFGVRFEPSQYILFKGATYSAENSSNFTVSLDQNINFSSTTFPSNTIIFSPGSGLIAGFSNGNDSITIVNSAGNNQKTIKLNRFGTVYQIN